MESFIEFYERFRDEQECVNYLSEQRWGKKPVCVHCDNKGAYKLKTRNILKCAKCRKQFSVRTGTIFEESRLPLQKWFLAIYLMTSLKKGISSVQLGKYLKITQSSAWFVQQRIRFALEQGSFDKQDGIVEMDEAYVGGKKTGGKRGRGADNKQPVFGIAKRGGSVRAQVVENVKASTLTPIIEETVSKKALLCTDEFKSYQKLGSRGFAHATVKHAVHEYVRGVVHTNNIENYWSHLKRGITGIYLQVSKKHLQKYCDEFSFRFNTGKLSDYDRFVACLGECKDKRLEYKELVKA